MRLRHTMTDDPETYPNRKEAALWDRLYPAR